MSVHNATPMGNKPLSQYPLLAVTTKFSQPSKNDFNKKDVLESFDIFEKPSLFCFDQLDEEASLKLKAVNDFIESLDIKQVCMTEVIGSLRHIESTKVHDCFAQQHKTPSTASMHNHSDVSSLKSLPLSLRRRIQLSSGLK